MNNIFRGLGIALVTPFKQNGEIDYDALERLIPNRKWCRLLYHFGNNGRKSLLIGKREKRTHKNHCQDSRRTRAYTEILWWQLHCCRCGRNKTNRLERHRRHTQHLPLLQQTEPRRIVPTLQSHCRSKPTSHRII